MRYAVILAGGSGTRLWPMSRRGRPKQLLPLIGGRSLLELAFQRLESLVEPSRCFVCAGEEHRPAILQVLPLPGSRFIGEPAGRDTLNAMALSTAVILREDPEAVMGVFTSDHLIEPQERFTALMEEGFQRVEADPRILLTFGVPPSRPAAGYGYLELGERLAGEARRVVRFREKPPLPEATGFVAAGPERFLWNSGLFMWQARTFLSCVQRYEPEAFRGMERIAKDWGTGSQEATLSAVYPTLKKISVDYAVMEPASQEDFVRIAALPMPLQWKDIGSWLSYAESGELDEQGNVAAAERQILLGSRDTIIVSEDPRHLIAAIGTQDLIIVHTPTATLVCRKDQAEQVKKLAEEAAARFGDEYT